MFSKRYVKIRPSSPLALILPLVAVWSTAVHGAFAESYWLSGLLDSQNDSLPLLLLPLAPQRRAPDQISSGCISNVCFDSVP